MLLKEKIISSRFNLTDARGIITVLDPKTDEVLYVGKATMPKRDQYDEAYVAIFGYADPAAVLDSDLKKEELDLPIPAKEKPTISAAKESIPAIQQPKASGTKAAPAPAPTSAQKFKDLPTTGGFGMKASAAFVSPSSPGNVMVGNSAAGAAPHSGKDSEEETDDGAE